MGTIEDYTGGKVLEDIARALGVFRTTGGKLNETEIGRKMLHNILEFEPIVISMEQAAAYIRRAKRVAVGERVCLALNPEAGFTESVFLDDMADGMVRAGMAKACPAEEAEAALRRYPKHPLIISKVSGRHAEICRSYPGECVYWLAEKRGLSCLERTKR
ncbi:hypothetical protein CHL67_03480 [Prosthecochloris sp. GSB1]|uniref:hypothetical protein n=1 Tax=Prosthecochloris sp. GSB1 TaxID=281093 RepID=UPI000B8D0947|nr:hypothetical protein [Prosthecochloris sp. GSB1]ASQ90111.1 hypothetical protein CHL67_03480 [Prosthecochloris sp. GSB1]